MADKIIPNLPKTEAVTIDDLMLVVDTPSSTQTNKKIMAWQSSLAILSHCLCRLVNCVLFG